ncbi:MAG TPA: glycosyltransferase [Bacteroidales bacterium]|nr:glycosyltransferase [Bacteroidales bacterium]
MITVIIPVLNNINYTDDLFLNIKENTISPSEIVLIDNGSKDNYKDLIKKYNDLNIKYVRNETNIGVNGAWNMGIEMSNYPLLTILNNDIIINRFFFQKIIKTMEDVSIGLCVPNTIKNKNFVDENVLPKIANLERREGWAFTIRKEIVTKIGYIPDSLKTFCGDDYLFMASKKAGFKNVKILNSNIFHVISATLKYDQAWKDRLKQEKSIWNRIWKEMKDD